MIINVSKQYVWGLVIGIYWVMGVWNLVLHSISDHSQRGKYNQLLILLHFPSSSQILRKDPECPEGLERPRDDIGPRG